MLDPRPTDEVKVGVVDRVGLLVAVAVDGRTEICGDVPQLVGLVPEEDTISAEKGHMKYRPVRIHPGDVSFAGIELEQLPLHADWDRVGHLVVDPNLDPPIEDLDNPVDSGVIVDWTSRSTRPELENMGRT